MKYLDEKDRRILETLLNDSSKSVHDIAEELNSKYQVTQDKKAYISPTTVHNRIKKLKEQGIIKRFTIEVYRNKIVGNILSFMLVSVRIKEIPQREIVNRLMVFQEVEEVAIVTGEVDLLVRLRVKSMKNLNNFILDKMRSIEGIGTSSTMITLEYSNKYQ